VDTDYTVKAVFFKHQFNSLRLIFTRACRRRRGLNRQPRCGNALFKKAGGQVAKLGQEGGNLAI
jgi:hypothetical protein